MRRNYRIPPLDMMLSAFVAINAAVTHKQRPAKYQKFFSGDRARAERRSTEFNLAEAGQGWNKLVEMINNGVGTHGLNRSM